MVAPGGGCVVFPWGACMVFPRGGMRGFSQGGAGVGYDEIRSMSGRYASYWNAFLLKQFFHKFTDLPFFVIVII